MKARRRALLGSCVLLEICAIFLWAWIQGKYEGILSLSFIHAVYAILTGILVCISMLVLRRSNTKKVMGALVAVVLLLYLMTTGCLLACLPRHTYAEAVDAVLAREGGVAWEASGKPHIAYYDERRGLAQGKYIVWVWADGGSESYIYDAYSGEWEQRQLEEW